MIPGAIGGLYALRAALDRAIEALTPLEPVLAAWQDAQENAAESAAQAREGTPTASNGADALSEAPRPITEPSEPGPTPAPGGNGADPGELVACARCGAQFDPGGGPGPRRKYCSPGCRTAAAADRAWAREQEAELNPEPLPAESERAFQMLAAPDDARSDPALLRPPALAWEQ